MSLSARDNRFCSSAFTACSSETLTRKEKRKKARGEKEIQMERQRQIYRESQREGTKIKPIIYLPGKSGKKNKTNKIKAVRKRKHGQQCNNGLLIDMM